MLTVPGAPLAFHVMAKPTGAVCNLDCEYCFFLSKEMLYPGSRFRMAADLQETYIRQLLEAHARAQEVVVAWQGGEPTMMGLDFFRRAIELERQYARPGQKILNTIQTNATLLDDEWGEFLKANGFLVGISIDGPPAMHDAYRVDKGGKPTFGRVMRGLDVLKRHGVDWNVLTTIHAVNGGHGREVYTFLRDELGATFIQFIPIIERATEATLPIADAGWGGGVKGRPLYTQDGTLVTHRSVGPAQYGRFLIEVFEEWVRRDIGAVYVQMFDTALANFYGEPRRDVRARRDLRHPAGPGAHRRPVLLRPLRRARLPARQHQRQAHAGPDRPAPAAAVRAGQARHADPLLPRLRCPVRLQRRLPQGPVRHLALRRTRPALPVPRLQELLPPRPAPMQAMFSAAARRPGPRRADDRLRQAGRPARPQRPLPLRAAD